VCRCAVPAVAPSDIQVVPGTVTATTAQLVWTNIDLSPDALHGYFRGFRVSFIIVCGCFRELQFERSDCSDCPDNRLHGLKAVT
jgi:hypothetical protein